MTADVAIVGAGVVGLCVASELTVRGVAVHIEDTHSAPGPHACSWWAGGMLAPFCEGESAEEPVVRLGQEATDWWQRQGVRPTRNGSLVVTLKRDRRELLRFARRTSGHYTVDAAAISELEPDLAGQFDEGLYFPQEAHISPRDALATLHERLRRSGAFEGESGKNETRIDCTGLAAASRLDNLRGVKGEMLVLHCPDVALARPIRLLHPRFPLYIVPRGDGVFMIGATQIESGDRRRATARSVMELLNAAFALHPAFGEAEILEIGVDARPAFPDNLPRIEHRDGVIYVNGLFRHGFLLAPALARMVADYVCDGRYPEVWHEAQGQWRDRGR